MMIQATETASVEVVSDQPIVQTVPADSPAQVSISEAARLLRSARKPKDAPVESAPAVDAPPVEAPQESADEAGNAAPSEEPPVATEEPIDAADNLPPVDRPRSWSVEDQSVWDALPREQQEKLAERERARDLEIRRRQDEIAEQRKAVEAEAEAAKQQRQQYAQVLERTLAYALAGPDAQQFADIQTPADARRLANEDPIRYTQYQAWKDEIRELGNQYQAVQQEQQQEAISSWQNFANREDQLFAEKVPAIKDADQAAKIRADARKYLTEGLGFSNQEIALAWDTPSWRDHRAQLALYHAAKHWAASQAVKKAPSKPLPPVQRPGVAGSVNASAEQQLKALEDQLNKTGSAKAAAELMKARRAMATRRA